MLAGVAAGVAETLDADPSLVRILWAMLAIFTGGIAFVVYIVMAIVVPEAPAGSETRTPTGPAVSERGGTPGSEPPTPGAPGTSDASPIGPPTGADGRLLGDRARGQAGRPTRPAGFETFRQWRAAGRVDPDHGRWLLPRSRVRAVIRLASLVADRVHRSRCPGHRPRRTSGTLVRVVAARPRAPGSDRNGG